MINCTTENSIKMVRMLERACSSMTLEGERRLVLLDEADYLSNDAQAALRGVVETLSKNNDFIMTANQPEKLSPAIHSRFHTVNFDFLATEELKTALFERLSFIASNENARIESIHIRSIVNRHFPDIRKMINVMQYESIAQQ